MSVLLFSIGKSVDSICLGALSKAQNYSDLDYIADKKNTFN
ncbi:MAG: hypothetical protein PHF25_08900 [Candidatus Margulisbacteria bacterium]|nr:hypothetical protein [Candidatus Margulisiibacteriota bacterium]